ncbi:response regulator [Aquimarina aquimarini]|uniref:response regulator n=1 Tax=Aquimarina aquimarini TaxID=1191734 RepID=UPI000D54E42D|nr:transporter substrate-binding domain-containing protein [Aquimarina aquimarini]
MRNRKRFLLLFILAPYLIFVFSCKEEKILTDTEIKWLEKNDSITIALFPYYPPYQFINDNNTIEGVFIEYLDLIEEKTGHTFKKKYYSDWLELISDIKNKKIDMILEAQPTEARNQYLNFYSGLFETPFVIVASKDTPSGISLNDFNNKTITVPTGYAAEEYLKKKYTGIKLHTYIDETTSLQKVQDGKHDAYFGPKTVANFLIKTKNLDNLSIISQTKYFYNPGLAIDKDNEVLNQIIKKSIHAISDQEKQDIIENWLYVKTTPFYTQPSFIIPIITLITSILFIVLGIHFYLGHIVKIRTRALRIAKNIAEKNDLLKTAFINNISHEIRAPMNTIIGFSKLLKEPEVTNNEKKRYINFIVNGSKQLIKSMDDILEISKLQTNQVTLTSEKADMHAVFETIFSVYEKEAKKKGISLILNNNLTEDQRYILTDTSKLIKSISGLLENAIKYTKRGAVLISCLAQKSTLIINVRDSGVGIDPKNQQLIFKSFSQSENQISRKYGELGLGLTISKEYINLMGGQLSFSSIPNKGSTFRIELPFYPIINEEKNTSYHLPHKESKTTPYIILIAEDGDVNYLVLKTILSKMEHYHFTIHRAKNGREALNFCEKNSSIDLIFMDMKMPEMNGYNATRLIKSIYPHLPIIAQTAYTTNEDVQHVFIAGCDDFIPKPIDPAILKKVIDKYLPKNSMQKSTKSLHPVF